MKLKHKLFSILLSLALICLLIPALQQPAKAANATSVTITGITLSSGKYLTENGTVVTSKPTSGGYAWFSSAGSLSLHDFKVGISGVRGISANGNLSIYLYGDNYIRTNTNHYAIYADGNVYIYGMDSGKLAAYSDEACAIYATGSVTLNSGDVEAVSYGSNVINAQAAVLIKGGTLEVISTTSDYPAIWAKTSINISGGDTTVTAPASAINCSSGYVTISGGRLTADSSASNGIYANGTVNLNGGITYIEGGLHGIRAGYCKVTGGYHKVTSTNTEKDSSYSAFSPTDGDKTKFIVDTDATAVGSNSAASANMVKVETADLFNYDRLECGNYVKVKGIPVPSSWYLKQGATKAEHDTTPSANYASFSGTTLTLDNFTSSTTNTVGIEAEKDTKLFLRGTSSFSTGSMLAIDVDGEVIVEEYDSTGGSLSLTGSSHLVKITGELELNEGTVTCVGGGNTVDVGTLNIDDGMLAISSTNVGLWVKGNATVDTGTLFVSASNSNGAYIEGSLKLNSGAANISSSGSIGCYAKGGTTVSGGSHTIVGYTDGLNTTSLSVTGGYLKARSTTSSNDGSYCALKVPADSFSVSTALSAAADGSNTAMPQVLLNSTALSTYDSVTIGNFVYVNGVEVCSGQYLANGGTKTSPNQPSGGYAYLSGATLILNNYSCSTSGTSAVKAFRDLTISLLGTNSLAGNSTVILSYGALEIKNSGSLTVNTSDYNAIYSTGKMTLSANVTATTNIGYALRSDDALLVTGGKVLAQSQSSKGAYAKGTISCAGGELTAVGNIGIESETSVNVNGGTINATGKQYGINSYGNVVVNRGSLTVNASNGMGIQSTGKLLLNGGTTTVTATNHGVSAVGLTASNTATLLTKSTSGGKSLNLTDTGSGKYSVGSNLTATASTYSDGSKGGPFILEDVDTYHYVYISPNTLKIAGISIPSGAYLASWGTVAQTTQPSGGYAYYNNGVLTLNNFVHSNTNGRVIEANGSLKIELVNENSFATADDHAIYVEGLLEITGDGKLSMLSEDEICVCVTHGLTVTSGTLQSSSTKQQAIRVTQGSLHLNGGSVVAFSAAKSAVSVSGATTVTGGHADFDGYLNALSTGKFSITGGEMYLRSMNISDSWETLYITSTASDAFFCAPNTKAEASTDDGGLNGTELDPSKLATYNFVQFRTSTLRISGVTLPDGMYLASGSSTPVTVEPAEGYAYYKDGVLTLFNYDDSDCLDYGIVCTNDLDIEVYGMNRLHGGIYVEYSLDMDGSGELKITAPFCGLECQFFMGIRNITVDLTVTGTDTPAIHAGYQLFTESARISVVSGGTGVGAETVTLGNTALTVDSAGYGIFGNQEVLVNNSYVTVDADLCGVYADELNMESGELTVVAQQDGLQINSFQMDFGTLSVQSTNGSSSHCAIAMGSPEFTLNSELIMRGNETTYGTLREITRDEISSMDRIEISNHVCTLIYVDELPAACEANGKEGYFYCECGKFFIDGEGLMPIEDPENWGIIPATGHDFAAVGYDESWHWNYCSVCGEQDTETFGLHDIGENGSCYMCGYVAGFQLSGSLTTFGSDEDFITMRLLKDGVVYAVMDLDGNLESYCFDLVAPGEYILEVSKKNHVTREYTVTVGSSDVTQDAKIHLKGDVTGDGRVNVGDTSRVYAHVKGTSKITDEYALKCADVTGDGRINVGDTSKIYAHVKGTSKLW